MTCGVEHTKKLPFGLTQELDMHVTSRSFIHISEYGAFVPFTFGQQLLAESSKASLGPPTRATEPASKKKLHLHARWLPLQAA